jgi:UDP:flavonoid glycosyltransferase YjiC (YdhE family)
VIHQIIDGVMCGPAARYAADTVAAIDAFQPAVVATHELLFGAMAAAEARGRRLAPFASNIWSLPTLPDAPPFGGGLPPPRTEFDYDFYRRITKATIEAFQYGLEPLNRVRAGLGLAPLAGLFDQLQAADRVLIATSRAFDYEQVLPEPYRHVGPYLADPAWTEDWSPPTASEGRPLVLVSFSTMYQNQGPVLRRAIEALGRLPVQGVVTLGPQLDPAAFPAPDNVAVAARAPHSRILPLASAVITHGGHASVLRPLMAGAPLVCVPLGRDQADNAARVAAAGAGIRLASDASADDIEAAVRAVLEAPSYRECARALGGRIAAVAAGRSADTELIALARMPGRKEPCA